MICIKKRQMAYKIGFKTKETNSYHNNTHSDGNFKYSFKY